MTTPSVLAYETPPARAPAAGDTLVARKFDGERRFAAVDALRGIASVWVVVFHAYEGKHIEGLLQSLPAAGRLFFHGGWLGVPVFFVLSGFVIAYTLRKASVGVGYFGRFTLRRSIRLDPPYWVSIAVVLAFGYLSARMVAGKEPPQVTPGQLLAHLFYLQDLLGYEPIGSIYWTLCLEIQFYLVFCALMGLAQTVGGTEPGPGGRRGLLGVFLPAALVSLLWATGLVEKNLTRGLFLPEWHGFLAGVFAYWAMSGVIAPAWFWAYAGLLLVGGVARAAGAATDERPQLWVFTIACAAVAAFLYAAGRAGRLQTWMNWRWLQFLGMVSYSLYLIHNPITGAVFRVGYRLTGTGLVWQAFWTAGSVAASIVAATLLWWLVERPSMALSKRFKDRREKSPAVTSDGAVAAPGAAPAT